MSSCRIEKDKESLKRDADDAKSHMDGLTRDKVILIRSKYNINNCGIYSSIQAGI